MLDICMVENGLPGLEDLWGLPVVDLLWRQVGDPGVVVFRIVPTEELAAEAESVLNGT